MKSEIDEKNRDEYILLDVRTVEETKLGMLDGAVNIPVDDLKNKLDSLDKNKEIYVYCRSGARASTAVNILTQNGYKAKNIGGYESLKNKK